MTPRARLLWILGALGAGLALTALASVRLDFAGLRAAAPLLRLWPWVPLGGAAYLAGHLLRGLRCRLLFDDLTSIGFRTAANIGAIGYATNNILPFRLGELARVAMIRERTGLPAAQALTIVLIERTLDVLSILVLLFVVVHHLPVAPPLTFQIIVGLAAVTVVGVLILVAAPDWVRGLLTRVAAKLPPRGQLFVLREGLGLVQGASRLRHPVDAARIIGLSLLIWVCEASLFVFLLPAAALAARPSSALQVMTAVDLGIVMPYSPGFIGPFHAACMQVLATLGAPADVGRAFALYAHAAFFLPITVWGASALVWYGAQVASRVRLARAALQPSAARAEAAVPMVRVGFQAATPPRRGAMPYLVTQICEAIVPWEALPSTVSDRPGLLTDVAAFVQGELESLPAYLRIQLVAGTTAFRVYVRLRHLRSFCALDLPKRVRIVDAWAYGGFSLGRKLFRVFRSTAHLAFFDHPAVRAAMLPPASKGELVRIGVRR